MSGTTDNETHYTTQLEKFSEFVRDMEDSPRLIEVFTLFREKQAEEKRQNSHVLPFGKYKYRTIKEVCQFDRKYLIWLVRQSSIEGYPDTKKNIASALE